MVRALRRLRRRLSKGERGFSLPETMTNIVVLGVAAAIVTGVVVLAFASNRTTTVTAASQSQLLDAVSRVTRDIAFSDPILPVPATGEEGNPNPVADAPNDVELWTQTIRDGDCLQTRYWVGEDPNHADSMALLSHTWVTSTVTDDCTGVPVPVWKDDPGSDAQGKVIVANLSKTTGVFVYYDGNGDPMVAPWDDVRAISRVEVNVSATVEGRSSPLELTTSAKPYTGLNGGSPVFSDLEPPASPIIAAGNGTCSSDGNVRITFAHVDGVVGYSVFRRSGNGQDVPQREQVSVSGNTAVFTQTGVQDGDTFVYTIIAYGAAGWSSSNPVTVTCAPGSVVLNGVTVDADNNGQVNDNRLTWTKPRGTVDGYIISWAGGTQTHQITDGNASTWTHRNQPWGSRTTYTVVAYNNSGTGVSMASNPVTLLLRPAVPNLTGTHANGDRTVNWAGVSSQDPASPAVRYEIERRYNNSGAWTREHTASGNGVVGAAFTWTDTSLYDAREFDYRVRAGNSAGWSTYASVALYPRPAVSPVVRAVPNDQFGQNHVTWNVVPNATCYNLYRGGARLATNLTATSFVDTQPGWGSSHLYMVRACNKTGEGGDSNVAQADQMPGPYGILNGGTRDRWVKYTTYRGTVHGPNNSESWMNWTVPEGAAWFDILVDGHRIGLGWRLEYWQAFTPGTTHTFQVIAGAHNGRTRLSEPRTVLTPPAPPATVRASTWCNKPLQMSGWKYGMEVFQGAPAGGQVDYFEILEDRYRTDGVHPGGAPWLPWAEYSIVGYHRLPVTNAWGTYPWGGWNDHVLISNTKWHGGGMLVNGFRENWYNANFGDRTSVTLGITGAIKQATGGVVCHRTNGDGWGFNGNWDVYNSWDWFW